MTAQDSYTEDLLFQRSEIKMRLPSIFAVPLHKYRRAGYRKYYAPDFVCEIIPRRASRRSAKATPISLLLIGSRGRNSNISYCSTPRTRSWESKNAHTHTQRERERERLTISNYTYQKRSLGCRSRSK